LACHAKPERRLVDLRVVVDVEGKMVYYSFKELIVSLGFVTKLLWAKEA
jgi:hypothetical protein